MQPDSLFLPFFFLNDSIVFYSSTSTISKARKFAAFLYYLYKNQYINQYI